MAYSGKFGGVAFHPEQKAWGTYHPIDANGIIDDRDDDDLKSFGISLGGGMHEQVSEAQCRSLSAADSTGRQSKWLVRWG